MEHSQDSFLYQATEKASRTSKSRTITSSTLNNALKLEINFLKTLARGNFFQKETTSLY